MAIEYELKFRATPEAIQQILDAYPQGHTHFQMATTYYDTPSGALSARHYTLRQRMENDISVCTLKTPAKEGGRQEIEIRCDHIEQAIPQMYQAGAPADLSSLLAEGIIPVCGAKFHRIAILVELWDSTVELALDQGILTGGERSMDLCEVEVEVKSGSRVTAILFARELSMDFGLVAEEHSKFRRAQALYKGESL